MVHSDKHNWIDELSPLEVADIAITSLIVPKTLKLILAGNANRLASFLYTEMDNKHLLCAFLLRLIFWVITIPGFEQFPTIGDFCLHMHVKKECS
ncbi:Hypothetical protein VS_1597 [Vibrio atlanticus]|uniref:Uncharacterized protein n=1 Tax=Vibrio atlanticus (strain LGP32) TaxID=575788 RepID=B7VP33_VIBA3|nr:Hypothetical protein VS_1597 [Vibrio atlanticus]